MALKRNRRLGPTQAKVLAAIKKAAPDDVSRNWLERETGLTLAQVRSALRGLLARELVTFSQDEKHRTAIRWWSLVDPPAPK